MMALARKIPQAHATVKAGKWDRKSFEGVELYNKTLGIIGMGRIGSEVARRAIAFEEVDVGKDAAADAEMQRLSGQHYVPTIVVDGHVLANFDVHHLEEFLSQLGF